MLDDHILKESVNKAFLRLKKNLEPQPDYLKRNENIKNQSTRKIFEITKYRFLKDKIKECDIKSLIKRNWNEDEVNNSNNEGQNVKRSCHEF